MRTKLTVGIDLPEAGHGCARRWCAHRRANHRSRTTQPATVRHPGSVDTMTAWRLRSPTSSPLLRFWRHAQIVEIDNGVPNAGVVVATQSNGHFREVLETELVKLAAGHYVFFGH
jgi:hypothetical protein